MDWNSVKGMGAAVAAAAVMLLAQPVAGDARDIGVLRTRQRELAASLDSLLQQRQRLVGEAQGLSARIDSLKEQGAEADGLHEALRSSLELVQRMVALDRQRDRLQAEQDSLRARLRLAYDWEIGTLIQRMAGAPDRGLLAQLSVYQQEREALGPQALDTELRFGEDMGISPDDGPEDIRLKMELMEDIASRLRREQQATANQLRRLEDEHRLRSRVQGFTSEISLFDEHQADGRVLVRVAATGGDRNPDGAPAGPTLGEEGLEDAYNDMTRDPGALELLPQAAPSQDEELMALGGAGSEDLVLEMHKLKAHQREIEQLEEVVRERAATFRQFLNQMLEGRE